jgi:hypothetical protein
MDTLLYILEIVWGVICLALMLVPPILWLWFLNDMDSDAEVRK